MCMSHIIILKLVTVWDNFLYSMISRFLGSNLSYLYRFRGLILEIIDGSLLSYRITTFLQLRIKTRRIIGQWKCEFNYSATHANSSSINFRFIYHFILKRNAFTRRLEYRGYHIRVYHLVIGWHTLETLI